jgi:urease gamma subunit
MLIERARNVKDKVEDLEAARQNRERENRFQNRHEKLRRLVEEVQPLASELRVLREEGIDIDYQGGNLDQIVQRIETIKDEFDSEAAWIIQDENDLSDLDKWIRRHRDKIQRKLQSTWRDYYQAQVPDFSDDLLNVLRRFDDFRGAVQTIRERSRQLQEWKDNPPDTKDSLSTFQELAEERRATWEQLRSDEMSEDVLSFLVDAGTEGATVEQLTDEVRTWLDQNDLLDRVHIRLTD